MTTDQDLKMDGQPATSVFATKGTDVTPKKDKGVVKVFTVIYLNCFKIVFLLALRNKYDSHDMVMIFHGLFYILC